MTLIIGENLIGHGKVVELVYTLKNAGGEVLDHSTNESPFSYIHGMGQIVPGLETALSGLRVGETKLVEVSPEEGYGPVNPALRLHVNRSQFPPDVELKLGMQFQTQTPEGYTLVFRICGLEEDQVQIDGNHPLAGEALHFDVSVLSVRAATAEEMDHGHVHGPGGHHH